MNKKQVNNICEHVSHYVINHLKERDDEFNTLKEEHDILLTHFCKCANSKVHNFVINDKNIKSSCQKFIPKGQISTFSYDCEKCGEFICDPCAVATIESHSNGIGTGIERCYICYRQLCYVCARILKEMTFCDHCINSTCLSCSNRKEWENCYYCKENVCSQCIRSGDFMYMCKVPTAFSEQVDKN